MEEGSKSATLVAFVPNLETLQWHHAREEFVAKELLGHQPQVKGALVVFQDDEASTTKRVWCVWTRVFGSEGSDDILYILRIVFPDTANAAPSNGSRAINTVESESGSQILAVASALRAAQFEAAKWGMSVVRAWNPTPTVISAATVLDPTLQVVDRQEDSITSLRWHQAELGEADGNVEWLGNEKFGWS